ncbi:putative F-box/FBD/LRR-repeat protein At4g03220 [Impatiens glandulifera]|uniref:putative F-box/FBD/LRR-repeat protein At4g03220 n=1 Tax=Impatiens glandulifera TaxID=253017 RepID=UPI001FB1892C|nr:putative F-box/FBD/LRR-repeat protein At4g03220 [Impatiens glandulifera]
MNPNEECLKEDDLISDLPDHIIHEILRFLPIKSAAQTLILSHRWKNVFSSIPYLDFTTIAASPPNLYIPPHVTRLRIPMEPPTDVKDINFLNKVFSLHDTNFAIKTLKLKSSELSSRAFNLLIQYQKINDIEELYVKVKNIPYFDIPWNIINCGRLRVLTLNIIFDDFQDLIKPSVMKREFKFLHTMSLHKIVGIKRKIRNEGYKRK